MSAATVSPGWPRPPGAVAAQVKLAGRGKIAKWYPNTELSSEHEAELCVAAGFDDVPW